MLYSGIDLHKHSLVIHTVDQEGATVKAAELPASRAAVRAYFSQLPAEHRAVVECIASWYWVRDLLAPEGIDLRLGHAKYLKAISYAKVKTDCVDAATLAQLLRVNLVPEAHMISAELARRKGKPIARALIAKELATIVYAVLSKGEPFNGTFRGRVLTQTKKPKWPRLASLPV